MWTIISDGCTAPNLWAAEYRPRHLVRARRERLINRARRISFRVLTDSCDLERLDRGPGQRDRTSARCGRCHREW